MMVSQFRLVELLLAMEGSQTGCRSHKRKTHAKTCPQRFAQLYPFAIRSVPRSDAGGRKDRKENQLES